MTVNGRDSLALECLRQATKDGEPQVSVDDDMSLVILENIGYVHLRGLPLGGGRIQQLGIVFATAYVVAEFIEIFKGPPPRDRRP